MKKKLLMTAMVAALGGVGTAQAVHVNSDGLGQVLIYPYYTVQNGFDSYINLVNTTNKVKAVKVRFLEGKNSQEVLDFNLYLSPKDEWSGVIVKTDTGAALKSADTSCIAPAQLPAAGQAFRNFAYSGDSVSSLARTREGYVEVIEMGVVTDAASATAATHVNGVPANCALIQTNAKTGGLFNDAKAANGIGLPEGGLYGFVTLINVNSGLKTTVDAVAIDNFFEGVLATDDLHALPGDTKPRLEDVDTTADIIDGNAIVAYNTNRGLPIDNISAILTRAAIANDYSIDAERESKTDWVITFPTKRFYVNGVVPATAVPFTQKWSSSTSSSCDEISLVYFDREERQHIVTVDEDFSPKPPTVVTKNLLCNEVNTLSIKPFGATASYNTLFGATYTNASFTVEDAGFKAGWLEVDFANTLPGTVVLTGLPVIGFAAMSNTNGTLTVGGVNVLSNYLGSSVHKGIRLIP